jgi:preprotein translocase subunit SecG
MGFIIGLLIAVMLLDCLALIFLVLIQLPKKEAGAGLAFGAGATDALFGAGSGTVLTKITRWAATTFFILCVLLAVMMSHYYRPSSTRFEQKLAQPASEPAVAASPAPAAAQPPPIVSPATNFPLSSAFPGATNATAVVSNVPVPALSNTPAEAPK